MNEWAVQTNEVLFVFYVLLQDREREDCDVIKYTLRRTYSHCSDFKKGALTLFPHVDPPPAPEKHQQQKNVKTSAPISH